MRHKEPPRIDPEPTPETKAIFDLRHTKACSIKYFREEMEKMERSRNKALADLAVVAQPVTKPKPKVMDIPCVLHPTIDINETIVVDDKPWEIAQTMNIATTDKEVAP